MTDTEQAMLPPKAPAEQQAPQQTPQERVEQLRAELAKAEAALPRDPQTTRVRVEPPITMFSFGGLVLGAVPEAVPNSRMAALMQAAADAGVTLTTEG
jgi:hypothetical protein